MHGTQTPSTRDDRPESTGARSDTSATRNRFLVAAGLATAGLVTAFGAFLLVGDDDDAVVTADTAAQEQPSDDAEGAASDVEPERDDADTDATEVVTAAESTSDEVVAEATESVDAATGSDATDVAAPVEADDTNAEVEEPDPDVADAVDEAADETTAASAEANVPADADGTDAGEMWVFEITQACAMTFHTPREDFPSYIEWLITAPGFDDGTEVTVTLFGPDGQQAGQIDTTVRNGYIAIDQGISSYGNYPYPAIGWTTAVDGSESEISIDHTHVVDEREAEPSKTCAA